MGKPVNLNRFRKQKARADARTRADENVARFGRSKTRKNQETEQADKAARDLDGHELDR